MRLTPHKIFIRTELAIDFSQPVQANRKCCKKCNKHRNFAKRYKVVWVRCHGAISLVSYLADIALGTMPFSRVTLSRMTHRRKTRFTMTSSIVIFFRMTSYKIPLSRMTSSIIILCRMTSSILILSEQNHCLFSALLSVGLINVNLLNVVLLSDVVLLVVIIPRPQPVCCNNFCKNSPPSFFSSTSKKGIF